MKKMLASSVALGISLALIGLGYYIFLPALNLRSPGFYFFTIMAFSIIAIFQVVTAYVTNEEDNILAKVSTIISGIGIVLIILVAIVGWFLSGKLFHSTSYKDVASIDIGNFENDFIDISKDPSQMAVVDMDTAIRLGDRTIGNIDHASWYEVDNEYNLIVYQGKQYRISPLNYGGFFKYNKAKNNGYLPGYVLVDNQTQEAKYVTVDGGIKYSPSAYFSYNLKRHLRSQYVSYIFGDSYFEIDENGNPYWITAVKTPTVGIFGCAVEKSFIVTNAIDGTSTEYTAEELPEWIDHSMGLDYLMDLAYWHYEYVNGYINFSKTGVYRTSYYYADDEKSFDGYNSFVNAKGEVCFYVGLSPANTAETNVGFLLVNTRTGKFTQYDCSGAEEMSSQNAAEGLVQNLGYNATFPTVVNVCGEETYFMCLKDKAGLIQRYALCNIENYSIVVEADSIDKVVELYFQKLGIEPTENDEISAKEKENVIGKITSIYTAEIEGTTYFYYMLENDKYLYKSSITINEKQVLLKEGDVVNIDYVASNSDIRDVVSIK